MKNDAVIGSHSYLRDANVPWVTFIFLAVVFFVAEHDLFFSIREQFTLSAEIYEARALGGSLPRRAVFSMLGLFGAINLLRRGQHRLKINGVLGWLILFYLVWASLSVTWADDLALTLRRIVVLWMLCLGALAVGKHFSLRDIILWVFFTTTLYLLVSLSLEAALGTFRPFTSGYRFAGTLHPNHQGVNCSLFLLATVAASRSTERGHKYFLLCAFVGIIFLILTGSRAGFVSGIAALLAFYWVLLSSRFLKLTWLLGISMGVCLILLLVVNDLFPALQKAALLGRTDSSISTLSNRIPLWEECLDYAAKRPLQGYGYNSFFTPSHIVEISATQGWGIAEVHSAFFELILGTGMVGMVSFVLILIVGIKRAIENYKVSPSPCYAFFIAIFLFSLLHGVLESTVVWATMLSFVVMVILVHLGFTVPQARTNGIRRGRGKVCSQ